MIWNRIKKAFSAPPSFDPTTIEDPMAQKTEWKPLKPGGANYRTHRLIESTHNTIVYKPRALVWIYLILTILFSVIFFLVFLFGSTDIEGELPKDITSWLIATAASITILVIGLRTFLRHNKRKTFNKSVGFYWEGKQNPREAYQYNQKANFVDLGDIYAIQLLREFVTSSENSYDSYELNLVLKDGSRINVVDHGRKQIFSEADQIALFLNVPLWDATIQQP